MPTEFVARQHDISTNMVPAPWDEEAQRGLQCCHTLGISENQILIMGPCLIQIVTVRQYSKVSESRGLHTLT